MRELPRELVDAACDGNFEIVQKHWLDVGGDVNAVHDGRLTLLKCAAMHGRADLVRYLLSRGADVNYATEYAETALQWACGGSSPDIEVLKLLISAGAKVNARNGNLWTPLGIYLFNESN